MNVDVHSVTVATLEDVARIARVSMSTASRVLAGSPKVVTEPLRGRVIAAAEHLGYVPNIAARTISRGTSSLIALLVDDLHDHFFTHLAMGAIHAAEEESLTVAVSLIGRDTQNASRVIRNLSSLRPRGVLIARSPLVEHDDVPRADLVLLESVGSKIIWLDAGHRSPDRVPIGGAASAQGSDDLSNAPSPYDIGYNAVRSCLSLSSPHPEPSPLGQRPTSAHFRPEEDIDGNHP